ncbi:MAG TPA: ATP-binding cassette domain-containing protein [Firmicutes bacterium]|nr:ATP-binding cassette domain-containing protein [Bacillota bacterium]
MNKRLIDVKNLKKYFDVGDGAKLHAIDDVSFSINKGETLGLVGESGCGKSTTGRVMLRLLPPTGGQVIFEGQDVLKANAQQMKRLRQKMQMIFQDPYSCLNPRKTVRQIIAEPLLVQRVLKGRALWAKVDDLMAETGITPEIADKYPHELDGGRRQRVGITRALALEPNFIVCDEPVSALDVSIQAQIINLLKELQEKMGLTYLFISHDLSVVKHISDRILVMYLGCIVEEADSEELFRNPQHPYTQALLSAIPQTKIEQRRKRIILTGDVPSPVNPAPGCRFAKRCWLTEKRCEQEMPELTECAPGHRVACHLINPHQ